jgi:hypothetical protein
MKQCNKCKETKPVSEFSKNKTFKDGLMHWCKKCKKQITNPSVQSMLYKTWATKTKGVYGMFYNELSLYVGESSRLNARISKHKSFIKNPNIASPDQKYLYEALQQYPNVEIRIIEECDNHKDRELYWRQQLNPLYNPIIF